MPGFFTPSTVLENDQGGEFLLNIVTNFMKILVFVPGEKFGSSYVSPFVYPGAAASTDEITLSIKGVAALFYAKIYKEAYPADPTPQQIIRMNIIWAGMGYPENIVPI